MDGRYHREDAHALRTRRHKDDATLVAHDVSTRYAFPAHLAGPFYRVTGIDSYVEITRILESHPRVLVLDRGWWPTIRRRAAVLVEAALEEQYELVATVPEERGPVEIWRLR